MTLPRQKLREAVLQLLFSFDQGVETREHLIALLMSQLKASGKNIKEAYLLAEDIWDKKADIDKAICALSHAFSLSRIHKTELQILRIGFYELIFKAVEIPPNVVIAEGIRLARKFATPAASLFINALLDQQKKKILGEDVDKKVLEGALTLHEQQSEREKGATLEGEKITLDKNEIT